MSDLSTIPLPLKLLLAAVALAAVIGLLSALFKTVYKPPYETRQFLSPAEVLFFRALQEAIDGDYLLFAKVRVGDLLSVVEGTKDSRNWFARIAQKHVDFMLADRETVTPLLVVELDDASHQRADRRERDEFLDGAFSAASLPILRVPCAAEYSTEHLAQQLRHYLGTPAHA